MVPARATPLASTSARIGELGATQEVVRREWLSYREAETLTGLSRTTLWKLIGTSDIEAARVGRAVRISRQSLSAYMRRLTRNPIAKSTDA
jgi:excisionase family DNA binding protein